MDYMDVSLRPKRERDSCRARQVHLEFSDRSQPVADKIHVLYLH